MPFRNSVAAVATQAGMRAEHPFRGDDAEQVDRSLRLRSGGARVRSRACCSERCWVLWAMRVTARRETLGRSGVPRHPSLRRNTMSLACSGGALSGAGSCSSCSAAQPDLAAGRTWAGDRHDVHARLLGAGSAIVLAQYYNFVRFGREGCADVASMQAEHSVAGAIPVGNWGSVARERPDSSALSRLPDSAASTTRRVEHSVASSPSRAQLDGARLHTRQTRTTSRWCALVGLTLTSTLAPFADDVARASDTLTRRRPAQTRPPGAKPARICTEKTRPRRRPTAGVTNDRVVPRERATMRNAVARLAAGRRRQRR